MTTSTIYISLQSQSIARMMHTLDRPTFLGLDASTQSLKASLLSDTLDIISELSIHFDTDLPHYGTKGGVLYEKDNVKEVFSPVVMVVEEMDLLFDKIKAARWDLRSIGGVAAAVQVSRFPSNTAKGS